MDVTLFPPTTNSSPPPTGATNNLSTYSFPNVGSRRSEVNAVLQGLDSHYDLSPWYNNMDYANMIFIVDNQRLFAHSAVIKARCPYFYSLMDNIVDYDGYYVEVEIRDCAPEIFAVILKYIYSEQIDIVPDNMWLIYDAAKNYQLDSLKTKAQNFILSQVHYDNVWDYIDTATQMDAEEIVEKCRNFAQTLYKEATTPRTSGPSKQSIHTSLTDFFQKSFLNDDLYQNYGSLSLETPPVPTNFSSPPYPTTQRTSISSAPAQIPINSSKSHSPIAPIAPAPGGAHPHHPMPSSHSLAPQHPGHGYPTQQSASPYQLPTAVSPAPAPAPLPASPVHIPALPSQPVPAPSSTAAASDDAQKTKREWTMEHLNYLAEMVRVLLDADRMSLFLYNEETKELCALMNNSCEIRIPYNLGVAGSVFTTGKLINSKDPYSDARFLSDVDKQTGYRTTSLLAMPISGNKGSIGVIEVLNKRAGGVPSYFTEDDEKTLNTVCHLAGSLLDKVREVYPPEAPIRSAATAPNITNDAHIRALQRLSIQQQIEKQEAGSLGPLHEEAKRAGNKRTKGEINWHRYKRGRKNSIPVFHFRISNNNTSEKSTNIKQEKPH
eukprot:TRINITY_DN513_c0_g1_i1.p1 TRINITY_DN513_c0_g1~~TRINITY_DN513_c0_g1_i1.p1  ORF type:complete len:690 (+),score=163.18 TRINITY_DN513_c0_g1_i1:258-2072(+)